MNKRKQRQCNGLNRDDPQYSIPQDNVAELLKGLEKKAEEARPGRFLLSEEFLDEQGTLALPKQGLPSDCAVHPKWRILVLKPQIALRSTADPTAIVLVALQEIAVKNYSIVDTQALDSAISEVLQRSYIAARGLQGFYPTEETMARSLKTSPDYRELDFVPLEIFLDVKSEATDYDRIILRADMGVTVDEFNHLRAPRGLEWPEATNEHGDRIDHLRLHQNMVTITMPTLTMSAKSKHWTALYYVITDLMIYTLPEKAQRKLKVDGFLLKFDRRDRDPQQLLWSLFIIQQHVRRLAELQRGYQNNFDRLTADGRRELFSIHADLLHEYEALNTVFDVINLNRSYEDAKAALQTKSRIDVRAGTIAWHMLREKGDPLMKLDIRHTLFAMDHNSDGSKDLAVAISDLRALNGSPEALFNEVLTKSTKEMSRRGPVSLLLCFSLTPSTRHALCLPRFPRFRKLAVSALCESLRSTSILCASGLSRPSATLLSTTCSTTRRSTIFRAAAVRAPAQLNSSPPIACHARSRSYRLPQRSLQLAPAVPIWPTKPAQHWTRAPTLTLMPKRCAVALPRIGRI